MADKKVRTSIVKESLWYFFHFYFAHYVKYASAPFQREIMGFMEDESVRNLAIIAFRGSAKSTLVTMCYPIWAILGKQQKKFILIVCQTVAQAKQHMANLKRELEANALLKNDLGPFQEEQSEWCASSLVFSKHGARITAVSVEQSIRGLRHNQYRPEVIIGDDLEDLESTRTRESRDKTYEWFTNEAIPAGDRDVRTIFVGNLLHEDSLLMRIKADMEQKKSGGVFKMYPLVDEDGNIAWLGKYPTLESIEMEKQKIGSDVAWLREYLLKIVRDDYQVIPTEWIHRYDELPDNSHLVEVIIGIDLAISEKQTADKTAMIVVHVYSMKNGMKACVLPHPINERLSFPDTIEAIKRLHALHKDHAPTLLIEEVAYQKAVVQQLFNDGYDPQGIHPLGDKRSRLTSISHLIKNGNIVFSRHGNEELIKQLTEFGKTRFDDLTDALTLVGQRIINENIGSNHVPVTIMRFACD